MGIVFVDGQEVEIEPNLNLIQAAQKVGVEIPHYCWHPDLSVVASCRMCLVEVGQKSTDGAEKMAPKLMPACQTICKPGTIVKTSTPKVKASQAQTLEYLLLNHPLDCSICDQAGECYLQDYTYKFGNAHSRLAEPKVHREDKYHIGEQIALFTDRCVMCTRCVRFTREISGTAELHVINRGSVGEIDVFPGEPCDNKLAGNVVDLCPVGALCSKDFLYKKRVWWLKSRNSVCTGCSTGCSIEIDQHENKVYRLRPRTNPQAQGSFICDDGRFGFKYIHSDLRLTTPRLGRFVATNFTNGNGSRAENTAVARRPEPDLNQAAFDDPWPSVLEQTRQVLRSATTQSKRLLGVFSPFMTCEEAYLLAKFLRSIDKNATLTLGPIPVVGEDDLYPKDFRGVAAEPAKAKFTIRAEKCPNRRGVAIVLRAFESKFGSYTQEASKIKQDQFGAAFIVGGDPQGWSDVAFIESFPTNMTLVAMDLLKSPLSDRADILLPSGSFAEREGTVVNFSGLAQSLRTAIRCPGDARADGRILMDLCNKPGLFNALAIRKKMVRELPSFVKLAEGQLPDQGVLLSIANTAGAES